MHRNHTLNRSALLALPLAALLVACGGQQPGDESANTAVGSPETQQTSEQAPNEATPETSEASDNPGTPTLEEGEVPVEVADDGSQDKVVDGAQLNADGSPISESGPAQSFGEETDEPDFLAEPDPATAGTDSDDDVGQSASALTSSSRRLWLLSEAKREYGFLNEPASYYSHTTYMNESTGTRRTDCSGYLNYALSRVLRTSYDRVNAATDGTSVKSEDWFNYLNNRPTTASSSLSSSRWRKIPYIKNLKPGDVLVWKNPSYMANSGHTMIVRDYPRAGRSSKNEILVPIYDSSAKPHAFNGAWDSRGTSDTGIGAGTIGIKVDSSGKGVAYYWTGGKSGDVTYRAVVGGRIE